MFTIIALNVVILDTIYISKSFSELEYTIGLLKISHTEMTLFDSDGHFSKVLQSPDKFSLVISTNRTRTVDALSKIYNDHITSKTPTRSLFRHSMETARGMTKTMSIHRRKKVL